MANHLVIGLGGTGGSVLRALRKRIYEEFKSTDPKEPVHIEYLYVDSNLSDLNNESDWQTLGVSVQLSPAQRLSINGVSAGLLENIDQYPGVEAFIDKNDEKSLQEIFSDARSADEFRRSRRWGRMLIANNMCGLPQDTFIGQVHARVRALKEKEATDDVTFHICAGLGGGTGSGSIVDAVTQIRNEFQRTGDDNRKFKILLYLYVPEKIIQIPEGEASNRFYQPNGYAALLELNAMSVGKYFPTDVKGTTDEYGNVNRLLKGQDAFDMAFLYTNVNEKGKEIDMYKELPHIVSDFLFYTMMGLFNVNDYLEYHSCGVYYKDFVYRCRFTTFGVKRIEYPETEVVEYCAYNFSHQCAMQMLYGLWDKTRGFIECTEDMVGKTYIHDVEKESELEANLLTDDYLMLSKPLPSIEKHVTNWKPIVQGWELYIDRYKQDVQNDFPKKEWYEEFNQLCQNFFDNAYRGYGVKKFYYDQETQISGYAEEIVRRIENGLFAKWKTGTMSVIEVHKYLTVLIAKSNERIEAFKDKITERTAYLNDDLAAQLEDIRRDWNNIGWLKDVITNAFIKTFGRFADAKREEMTLINSIYGYGFAVKLLSEIVNLLTLLNVNSVEPFMRTMQEFSDMMRKRAADVGKFLEEFESENLEVYNFEEVRSIVSALLLNEERQKENVADLRKLIIETLGSNSEAFSHFVKKVKIYNLFNVIFPKVLMKAYKDMEDYSVEHPDSRLVNVNILKILRKANCSTEDKRKQFVSRFCKTCQSLLTFNKSEYDRSDCSNIFTLYLPECKEYPEFRNELIKDFRFNSVGYFMCENMIGYIEKNQIVLVSVRSPFPLFNVDNIRVLKEKYDMLSKDEVNWVHTENSIIEQLSSFKLNPKVNPFY